MTASFQRVLWNIFSLWAMCLLIRKSRYLLEKLGQFCNLLAATENSYVEEVEETLKLVGMHTHFFYMANPLINDDDAFIVQRRYGDCYFQGRLWAPKTFLSDKEEALAISFIFLPLTCSHSQIMKCVRDTYSSQFAHNLNSIKNDGRYLEALCVPTVIRSSHGSFDFERNQLVLSPSFSGVDMHVFCRNMMRLLHGKVCPLVLRVTDDAVLHLQKFKIPFLNSCFSEGFKNIPELKLGLFRWPADEKMVKVDMF